MDISNIKYKLKIMFHKYKYAVVVALVGICLMLVPARGGNKKQESVDNSQDAAVITTQQELEDILSSIKGVGKVRVMLKEGKGTETVYESNRSASTQEDSNNVKTEVITVTDADRNEVGLIKQVNPPQYQGAIVICQGANDPNVRLAVTEAVSKITGLGIDKIAVLIMK